MGERRGPLESLVEGITTSRPAWKGRQVFVTGATGFVGAWITHTLVASGARVVCLVRDVDPHSLFFRGGIDKRAVLISGTLQDYLLIERILRQYEIDTCFHLAAEAIVPVAGGSPLSTFESNIKGTWHVLEAVRRAPALQRLVVASSDKAYGLQPHLPYSEEYPLQGRHPYDVSKSCADLLAQAYGEMYGLPVGITRCANIYGPGDMNWSRLIPGTIRSVLQGERPIIRSDGRYTRDYLYIADAIDAYLELALRLDDPAVRGQAFNFGHGLPVSVLDLVQKLIALGPNRDLVPLVTNTARGEIRDQFLSSDKAKRLLGWQARWSLEDGLTRTFRWYEALLQEAPSEDRTSADSR